MTESTETPSDYVLARRTRAGDRDAFAALVRRYERSLLALIRGRLGPVDAVADVLQGDARAGLERLRSQEPREPKAWLYQVARNRCRDYLRGTECREDPSTASSSDASKPTLPTVWSSTATRTCTATTT